MKKCAKSKMSKLKESFRKELERKEKQKVEVVLGEGVESNQICAISSDIENCTSVVNVKVRYIRPLGYNNLREWVSDPNNVYIGRAGVVFVEKERYPKESSVFANIFKVGKDGTRDEVIKKYEEYMREKLKGDDNLKKQLMVLKGKRLGCWCKPEGCHGDVLVQLIKELEADKQ